LYSDPLWNLGFSFKESISEAVELRPKQPDAKENKAAEQV
jgi:hypothetical protein